MKYLSKANQRNFNELYNCRLCVLFTVSFAERFIYYSYKMKTFLVFVFTLNSVLFHLRILSRKNVHSQRKIFQGEEHKKSVGKQDKSFYMMKWNLF